MPTQNINGAKHSLANSQSKKEIIEKNSYQLEQWFKGGYADALIPLYAGDKVPIGNEWDSKKHSQEGLKQAAAKGDNFGLKLPGRFIAIDVEGSAVGSELVEIVREMFPDAPVRTRPGSSSSAFLLGIDTSEGPLTRWEFLRPLGELEGESDKIVEVLMSGQLHVLGVRADKQNARLKWHQMVPINYLPTINTTQLQALGERVEAFLKSKNINTALRKGGSKGTALVVGSWTTERISEPLLRRALDAIPRDAAFATRDRRVEMLHAISGASEHSDEGRELWLEWDAQEHPDGAPHKRGAAEEQWDRLPDEVRLGAGFFRKELERLEEFALRDEIMAECAGARFERLIEAQAQETQEPLETSDAPLPDIPGGLYTPDIMMSEINARFALLNRNGDVLICHRNSVGDDIFMAVQSFHLFLANIAVELRQGKETKIAPASKWWMHNPERPGVRQLVFETKRPIRTNEYNLWRGFGVEPVEGTDLISSFDAHLREVVCNDDAAKYNYLMRWMAWVVQNPEKPAKVVPVLISEREGTGKSTVSGVLHKIFGAHARVISDPEELLGTHAGQGLEVACFIQLEEALFAGSNREADRMKHKVTGDFIFINPKGFKSYQAPNRMSAILTTNHRHAIHAGTGARRFYPIQVNEDKAGDVVWFNKIYADLEAGGYGQLLNYLLTMNLGSWVPTNFKRTEELAEQQIRSAGSVEQWLMACSLHEAVPGFDGSKLSQIYDLALDEPHPTHDLHASYVAYTRHSGGNKPESLVSFSKTLTRILGEDARKTVRVHDNESKTKTRRQVRAFTLGDPDALHGLVEKHLGIE